jgi:hypothetical protein
MKVMPALIKIWVNEDVTGDAVGILLEGAELVEIDGELYPMLEMAPLEAMRVAQAIGECVADIAGRKG